MGGCDPSGGSAGNVAAPPAPPDEPNDPAVPPEACTTALRVTCAQFAEAYLKASNTGADDYFGYSVALSGDTLAVGAYREAGNATGVNGNQADNTATDSGAVYVRRIAP